MRNSFLEVNLNNISYNLKQIKKFIGKDVELVPVIKANAYGVGAVNLKSVLEENCINYVCVAIPDEAIILRNNNFNMNILVLNVLKHVKHVKKMEMPLVPRALKSTWSS